MSSKPLSSAERAWLKQLQDLIKKCPSNRMAAYTTGDNDITLYDKSFNAQIDEIMDRSNDDFCGAAEECDVNLGSCKCPLQILTKSG